MDAPWTPLLSTAQSAYAELLDVTRRTEIERSVENLSGSFSKKTVRGSSYWYYQYTDVASGQLKQFFVGPDNDQLRALVERSRLSDGKSVAHLARAAIALGCSATTPVHFRIVRRLAEVGFFQAGGVLVGTHAFLAYGNALGVVWGPLSRTNDIDFAHAGKNVQLALPGGLQVKTRSAIDSLEMGFLPTPGFRPWEKTGRFYSPRDRALTIDFLTPMKGGKTDVYEHEQLGVPLQPIRFLEFILEEIQQAVVLSTSGACLVNVPDPGRYAIHKLLVYAERRQRSPEKAHKDLLQAAALISVLAGDQADRIFALWKDIHSRGPGWRQRARKALPALEAVLPDSPLKQRISAYRYSAK